MICLSKSSIENYDFLSIYPYILSASISLHAVEALGITKSVSRAICLESPVWMPASCSSSSFGIMTFLYCLSEFIESTVIKYFPSTFSVIGPSFCKINYIEVSFPVLLASGEALTSTSPRLISYTLIPSPDRCCSGLRPSGTY